MVVGGEPRPHTPCCLLTVTVLLRPVGLQVGEFYEAVGIDAVLLVQHAGLNPMGSGVPPRAGCPKQVGCCIGVPWASACC